MSLLKQPTARELEAALSELGTLIADHAQHGERSQVVFYYSGHARARSLSRSRPRFTRTPSDEPPRRAICPAP